MLPFSERDGHSGRSEITGATNGRPSTSGNAAISASAAATCAERRLVQHEVERGLAVVEALDELRDRHLVRGEPARGVREHARLVGDVEVDVERRAPVAVRVELLELAPARVVLEEAGAGGADDAHEVGDDGGRRLDAARARALRA